MTITGFPRIDGQDSLPAAHDLGMGTDMPFIITLAEVIMNKGANFLQRPARLGDKRRQCMKHMGHVFPDLKLAGNFSHSCLFRHTLRIAEQHFRATHLKQYGGQTRVISINR